MAANLKAIDATLFMPFNATKDLPAPVLSTRTCAMTSPVLSPLMMLLTAFMA
jgi:hypothetical protein